MRAKDAIGRYGERVAAAHLLDQGLEILDRNWRCAAGELDIVARDGEVIVFCEVKTRSSIAFGDPSEAVAGAKAARVRRLAVHWLEQRRATAGPRFWPELRFDVISVLRQDRGAAIVQHRRAAF